MTNNNRERVIRIEKGQTLWVVCPPLQPFRVFFDSKLNDLAIAECEPQDVPAIEENAPAIPERIEVTAEQHAAARRLAGLDPPAPDSYYGSDPEVDAAIEQGLLKPVFPERFNKSTEQQHVDAVTESLGPVAGLYKHEKQVLGATITTYTDKPESPFKPEQPVDTRPRPHTPECIERSQTELAFRCTCGASPAKPQADLFSVDEDGNLHKIRPDSDIPFDLS